MALQTAWTPVSRRIGNTGMAVYPLALDGSVFGWAADAADTAEMLELFTGVGGNLVSTADHYAGGRSEIMLGSWLRRSGNRERVVLATKIGRHPDTPGLSRRAVRRAVEGSLARLETDRIDLLSFDGDDPDTDVEESLTAVAELVADGRVGHLAAAGWGAAQLRSAVHAARRLELTGIAAVITDYNLLQREPYESDIAQVAVAQDLGVLARLPLAGGYLRGDFRSRSDRPRSPVFAAALQHVGRRGSRVLSVLDDIARQTGRHVGQVALAWLLANSRVAAPVLRVPDAAALLDLLPAVDLVLSTEQLERLDRVSAR